MTDRYPYRHHGQAVHGSKLTDYLISEANMIEDLEQLRAENARLRGVNSRLKQMLTGAVEGPWREHQKEEARAALSADPAPVAEVTVQEAAKVLLDNCPNPIFDSLKPKLIGEFSQSLPVFDADGNETTRAVNISWVNIKLILASALRAIAGENGNENG